MKKGIFYSMLLMLSFSLMSSTCSSDDDGGTNPNDNSVLIAAVTATAQNGSWRITSYIDSGQNETSDYNGYNFTFSSNNVLTATNGNETVTGTWSVTDSNSNDDSNDDIDFNISFPVPETNVFEDLNDDWDIVSYTSTRIQLIDVSGGNGGTDTLTFELN